MKKLLRFFSLAGILFISVIVFGCDSAADGISNVSGGTQNEEQNPQDDQTNPKDDPSNPNENPVTTKGVFSKPISFTAETNSENQDWGAYTPDMDRPFTIKKGSSYIVKGKAEIGTPSAGKIVELIFQENGSWSGWKTLKRDRVNGLNGKTFDFEYRWYPWNMTDAVITKEHDALQLVLKWDSKQNNATCSCTIHELTVTEDTSELALIPTYTVMAEAWRDTDGNKEKNGYGSQEFTLPDNYKFSIEQGYNYIINGKIKIGAPSAGTIGAFFIENVCPVLNGDVNLNGNVESNLNDQTFDFEYKFSSDDGYFPVSKYNNISIRLDWQEEGFTEGAECTFSLLEFSVTKDTDTYTTVTCSSKYAGPSWTVEDDWESLTIDFAEVPSNMQMCTAGDAVQSHEAYGDSYYSTYTGAIRETSVTITIATMLARLKELSPDVTKVASIKLMDLGDGNGVVKIKSVTATKTDGTSKRLTIPQPDWGYSLK